MNNNNMHIVKLYFPSVDKDNKPLECLLSTRIYKSLCQDVCKISGGLTKYPVQGIYVSSTGKIIEDDISLISTYTDQLDKMINIVKQYSMIILKELNQESVMIEIDDKLEFITQ